MGALGLLLAYPWPVAASAQPTNVLLVVADDFGTDQLGVYGELRPGAPTPPEHLATPNIAALAAEGLLFRNVWASPYCSAGRAALISGRYGFRTGVGSATGLLPPSEMTIPRALAQHTSIASAAIGKWHITNYRPSNPNPQYTPLEAGFGEFRGTYANIPDYYSWEKAVEVVPNVPVVVPNHPVYAATDNVDDAIDWISEQTSPWFLYVAPNLIHTPLQAPPDELHSQQDIKDQFEPGDISPANRRMSTAMLEAMDTELGRLFGVIDFETTMVIFTADNGTVSSIAVPDRIHRSGKGAIYEGGIRVPLIVAGAGVGAAPGSETTALAHVADLFATVIELFGVPLGDVQTLSPLDSRSLLPVLADPSATVRTTVYTDGDFLQTVNPGIEAPNRHDVAIRDARYKLIRRACAASIELFDLVADPRERTSQALDWTSAANRPVLARLWAELVAVTGSSRSGCTPEPVACEDGIDGDGDGAVDFPDDVDCTSPLDTSEGEPPVACADGADNDGDGLVDTADPGCADAGDTDELNATIACDDGVDNDGDDLVDSADPGCEDATDTDEMDELAACADQLDNDGDGLVDMADPGCADAGDTDELNATIACDDGVDNDGDNLVDSADPGCPNPYANNEKPVCDDGLDNDGDGFVDFADPQCTPQRIASERPAACGLGAELVVVTGLLAALGSRRRLA